MIPKTNEEKAKFLADQLKKQGVPVMEEFYDGFYQGALVAFNIESKSVAIESLLDSSSKIQVDPKFTTRMYTEQEVRDAILKAIAFYSNLNCKGPDKRTLDIVDRAIKSLG